MVTTRATSLTTCEQGYGAYRPGGDRLDRLRPDPFHSHRLMSLPVLPILRPIRPAHAPRRLLWRMLWRVRKRIPSVAAHAFAPLAFAALALAALALAALAFAAPTELGAQSAPPTTRGTDSVRQGSGLATPGAIARDARNLAQRVGLWASVAGGRGSAGLQCASCRAGSTPALALQLAVGGQPHPRFHVGIEMWSWLDVLGGGLDRTARGTQVVARHYPLSDERLFVTGGVGTSRYSVDDGDTRFAASAPALSLGLGWDLPFRGVVLSPTVVMVASTGGALTSDRTGNSVADNARLGFWRSTVSITWF